MTGQVRTDHRAVVKLQLANPTQLQLVGVGVDFVFPWKKKEEGITHT